MRSPLIASAFFVLGASLAGAAEPDGKALELFERNIRPVLVEHCYGCHSAEAEGRKKLKGGLRLDNREALSRGGDSGPALVPGKPDESLLVEALRYGGDVKMPPKGKLPDAVVRDFEAWIARGAPDPRTGTAAPPPRPAINLEAGRAHWAYRPPRESAPPVVKDADWPLGAIDRFVLAGLEAQGLRPVGDADRATLARRLYFDLIGLPPTPEEMDAFVTDPAPTAYEGLVERLLASPHFGERWGRHWLDVARFGESLTLRGFVLKEAWRYRDYVIDAFNADLPYDRFVREQVAGDLLPASGLADRRRQLVATTFLVLGNTNLEDQDKEQLRMDVVDEQIDTIGKAFLAQTIGCARCHDHKFDPIPTRDYYALAGILRNVKTLEHANVSKWIERPMPVGPGEEKALREHDEKVADLEAKIKQERARSPGAGGGVLAVKDVPGVVVDDAQARKVGEWTESRSITPYIGAGYVHDGNTGKGEKSLTFQPDLTQAGEYDVRLAYTAASNRAPAVSVTVMSADGEKTITIDMRKAPPIDGRYVALGRYRFETNGQGYVLISNEGTTGHVIADAVVFLPADRAPAPVASSAGDRIRTWEDELKRFRARAPKRELFMTVVEESAISDARVHVRGSVHNLGETAPRGFLRVTTFGPVPALPSNESGRRELADWLASDRNPLTARVFVNRAWHWLFGAGLVRTPDNFGTTGETPSHPALLDDMAVRFKADGWSVKGLVRRIVLSRTYRLASADDPQSRALDPENRRLWRSNRRRLDAECLRDAMLAVGGRLDRAHGGPAFEPELAADYGFKYAGIRRSVYAPVFRNALLELFEAFDFADPSLVTGRRNVSTVAPQALYLLNHPFVMEQASAAGRRLLAEPGLDDRSRLDRAYRRTLGRPPEESERRIGLEYVGRSNAEDAWAAVFHVLFASMDFRYVN